jgi:hypothetical protein
MAGINVDRNTFDVRSGEAIMSLRKALGQVRNIAVWLSNNPGSGATDPLVVEFNYSEDEAYLIRLVFEHFEAVRVAEENMLTTARKLTGLE